MSDSEKCRNLRTRHRAVQSELPRGTAPRPGGGTWLLPTYRPYGQFLCQCHGLSLHNFGFGAPCPPASSPMGQHP